MDITEGLMRVQQLQGAFVSDLRLDNILIDNSTGRDRAVLVDFEQGRNFWNWAAPEMYSYEWIAELSSQSFTTGRLEDVDSGLEARHDHLIEQFLQAKGNPPLPVSKSKPYDNPPSGYYPPWLVSNPGEQESAMVFTLGKVLWCLFEGVADGHNVFGRSLPARNPAFDPEVHPRC